MAIKNEEFVVGASAIDTVMSFIQKNDHVLLLMVNIDFDKIFETGKIPANTFVDSAPEYSHVADNLREKLVSTSHDFFKNLFDPKILFNPEEKDELRDMSVCKRELVHSTSLHRRGRSRSELRRHRI